MRHDNANSREESGGVNALKTWQLLGAQPILKWDLGVGVQACDVAWAPFSSTVFAVVSDDGKVGSPATCH